MELLRSLFGSGLRFGLAMSAHIRQLQVYCLRLMLALPIGLGLGFWTEEERKAIVSLTSETKLFFCFGALYISIDVSC